MFDQKRMSQVVVCVDEYKKRKKIFHKFRDICTEILSHDNAFEMSNPSARRSLSSPFLIPKLWPTFRLRFVPPKIRKN